VSLKRLLIERTEGNPLFIEESVRALAETDALRGSRGEYRLNVTCTDLEVPATVEAILAARIDRLSPQDKGLLQAAAVIGKDIPVVVLSAIAELPQETVRKALTRLQTAEFVYETSLIADREFTFKHSLTHEVAYATLLQEHRRALHARILRVIEELNADRLAEHAERLAHHAFRGELWLKAFQYLRQAGARAFSRSANREAVAWFDQALVALDHLPETRDRLEQAIELRFDLRGALLALGELGRLSESLLEAETLAGTLGDQRRLARVFAYRGYLLHAIGHQGQAIEYGRRAIEVSKIAEDSNVTVAANYYLGLVYHSLGDYQGAVQCHRFTVETLVEERIRERFGMAGFPAVMARSFLAWSLAELGQFVDAIAIGDEGVRLASDMKQSYSHALAAGWLGCVYLRKGLLKQAIYSLEHSLTLCQSLSLRLLFPIVASFLGPAYAWSGLSQRAIPLLEEALEAAASMGTMHYRSLEVAALSEAYLLAGRTLDAVALARQALELSQAHKERGWEAWILRLIGEIGLRRDPPDADAAEERFGQALDLGKAIGMRPLVARCHLGLGELAQKMGRNEDAREQLTIAAVMLRDMDMQFCLEKAQSALRAL